MHDDALWCDSICSLRLNAILNDRNEFLCVHNLTTEIKGVYSRLVVCYVHVHQKDADKQPLRATPSKELIAVLVLDPWKETFDPSKTPLDLTKKD